MAMLLVIWFSKLGVDNGCDNLESPFRRLGRSPASCPDHPAARVQHMSVSVPQILIAEMALRIVLAGRPMDIRQRHEPFA